MVLNAELCKGKRGDLKIDLWETDHHTGPKFISEEADHTQKWVQKSNRSNGKSQMKLIHVPWYGASAFRS